MFERLYSLVRCVKMLFPHILGIRYRKCISSVNTSLNKDESRYLTNNVTLYIYGSKLDVRCKNISNKNKNDIYTIIRAVFYDELHHTTLQNWP